MNAITLKYADVDDVSFILSAQQMPHIRENVTGKPERYIAAQIGAAQNAYLVGLNDQNNRVAFAHLRGLSSTHRSAELMQFAVCESSKGYGGSFLPLIMQEVFEKYSANRLWLDVFPDNPRAIALYRRCGFVEEGVLRDAYFWEDRFRSVIIMSILAKEYLA